MTNATLTVRRLPDVFRNMEPGPPREMNGTVRRTNVGTLFTVQGRGTFVWAMTEKMLTRTGEGTLSRYIVDDFHMDNANTMDDTTLTDTTTQPEASSAPVAAESAATPTPTTSEEVDPAVEAAILTSVAAGPLKMREIQEATKLEDSVLRPALAIMKRKGLLVTTGQTRGTRYSVA